MRRRSDVEIPAIGGIKRQWMIRRSAPLYLLPSGADKSRLGIVRRVPSPDAELQPALCVNRKIDFPEPPSVIMLPAIKSTKLVFFRRNAAYLLRHIFLSNGVPYVSTLYKNSRVSQNCKQRSLSELTHQETPPPFRPNFLLRCTPIPS